MKVRSAVLEFSNVPDLVSRGQELGIVLVQPDPNCKILVEFQAVRVALDADEARKLFRALLATLDAFAVAEGEVKGREVKGRDVK